MSLLTTLAREQWSLGVAGWSMVAAAAALVALRAQGQRSEVHSARQIMKSVEKLLGKRWQ
ncbi:MAG: hypothetical protein K2P33_01525 [Acutalibacter sp.]|nr:hypothetical protein [Acutalibacter sp.]